MNIQEEEKKAEEFTFALCLSRGNLGNHLSIFTDVGLNVIGLRLMCATPKFLEAHFKKEGRKTSTDIQWKRLCSCLLLAIKLEGNDAVKKAYELVSTKQKRPWWPVFYSSDSVQSAREDAAMWFCTDSPNWKEEELRKNHLTFFLPDHNICGGSMSEVLAVKQISFELEYEPQRFILIRQKALQKGMMPMLLRAIQESCFIIRGLKLVKKSEAPCSVAWSDSSSSSGETDEEEFGIACIVGCVPLDFEKEGLICLGKQCVSRELVYVSKEGESLKFIAEFFKFGLVGWVDPITNGVCGGWFESTLTGLQFEDDCEPTLTGLLFEDDCD